MTSRPGPWRAILWVVETALGLATAYLVLLSALAWLAPRRTSTAGVKPAHRFLVLVPAHDEERLLPRLLASLRELDYPSSMCSVFVVADNCTDRTAEIARGAGATVLERFDTSALGKGYALQWLLRRIWDAKVPHDAVLILDADSSVSRNFLRVMDARLSRGERVIQSYYSARDPDRAWAVGLRYAALAAVHYLRPQGKTVLGASAGLKGNGMVFTADVLKEHLWPTSLTEDIEYHLQLILAGERVTFAPDAVVQAEMPDTLAGSHSQNVRWERGRLEMVKRYAPRLLRDARRRRCVVPLDAAIEQAIPPMSILGAASVATLLTTVLLDRVIGRDGGSGCRRERTASAQTTIGLGIVVGQALYVLSALLLARAPVSAYRDLLYTPIFVVWKVWVYARVLLGLDRQGWIRTTRDKKCAK